MANWTHTDRGIGQYITELTSGLDSTGTLLADPEDDAIDAIMDAWADIITWGGNTGGSWISRCKQYPAATVIYSQGVNTNSTAPRGNKLAPVGHLFPDKLCDHLRARGCTPVIDMGRWIGDADGWRVQDFVDGDHDAVIVAFGEAIGTWMNNKPSTGTNYKDKPYENEIVVRLGPEANGGWKLWNAPGYPDGGTNWKNAHIRFRAKLREGIDNVKTGSTTADDLKMMFHVMQTGTTAIAEGFYPGDAYTDILGISVYDHNGNGLPTMKDDVDDWVDWAWNLNNDLYIWLAEVGAHWTGDPDYNDPAVNNNATRGEWVDDGYRAIHQSTGNKWEATKVFLYSNYEDIPNEWIWTIRGNNATGNPASDTSLKALYGLLTMDYRFRPDSIWDV